MRLDVELRDGRILVGGVPRVLRAGEVHHFRLERDGWRRRLELLRDAGADTVVTYVRRSPADDQQDRPGAFGRSRSLRPRRLLGRAGRRTGRRTAGAGFLDRRGEGVGLASGA